MNTEHIVTLLIEERDRLTRAIEVLQGSRGRHAKALRPVTATVSNGAGVAKTRPGMSAATRKAASERMRKYWAAKRKSAASAKSKS